MVVGLLKISFLFFVLLPFVVLIAWLKEEQNSFTSKTAHAFLETETDTTLFWFQMEEQCMQVSTLVAKT